MSSSSKNAKHAERSARDVADRRRERAAAKAAYQGTESQVKALSPTVKQRIRDRAERERAAAKSHYFRKGTS